MCSSDLVVERSIDRTELYVCDEAFLCGSAMEITPVISVDKYVVGKGDAGKITDKLHKLYLEIATGEENKFTGWAEPIY